MKNKKFTLIELEKPSTFHLHQRKFSSPTKVGEVKCKKHFTLIELIIVIVVIGILTGIAIPKFTGVIREAKVAAMFFIFHFGKFKNDNFSLILWNVQSS